MVAAGTALVALVALLAVFVAGFGSGGFGSGGGGSGGGGDAAAAGQAGRGGAATAPTDLGEAVGGANDATPSGAAGSATSGPDAAAGTATASPAGPGTPGAAPSSPLVGAAAAPATAPPPPPPAAAAPAAAGWGTPVLVDTFDGGLDRSRWWVYDSPNATDFPRSPDRASAGGGMLRLVGGYDAAGRDTSGGVGSTFNQLYGRWEVTFRAERGAGYSAVVLLWPQTENWPADGEIDVAEVTEGHRQGAAANLHNGPDNRVVGHVMGGDFTQWRTVAVEWLPQRVTVLLDGVAVWTVQRPATGFNHIPSASPMHLALQLDRGCVYGLPCRDSSTPAQVTMFVDQVRVWRAPASMLG